MKAQQEVYGCSETRRTLGAAKDEGYYLLSCLITIHHCLFLRPPAHDWLDSWRHFSDLKHEMKEATWTTYVA